MPGIIYVTDTVPRDQKFIADLPKVLAEAAGEHLATGNGGVFWLAQPRL